MLQPVTGMSEAPTRQCDPAHVHTTIRQPQRPAHGIGRTAAAEYDAVRGGGRWRLKKQRDSYSIEPAGTLIAMMEVSLLPYCPECGAQFDAGAKFCAECGARLERVNASGQPSRVGGEPQAQQLEHVLWEGRPYLKEITTNTKYILTTQRLIIQMGLLGRREEQIDLGRVKDIRLTQGVSDRMIGIGQIEVISTDPSTPSFRLMGIRDPRTVRDLIWSAVNQRRSAMGIRPRELL